MFQLDSNQPLDIPNILSIELHSKLKIQPCSILSLGATVSIINGKK